jgi:hypothetical protein
VSAATATAADVPRVNERDALGGRSGGKSDLSYMVRATEEVLHEVISPQDSAGNVALLDPPLSIAIPLRETNGVVVGDFPRQSNDVFQTDLFGFSQKVSSWRPWSGEPAVTRNSVSMPRNAAARLLGF